MQQTNTTPGARPLTRRRPTALSAAVATALAAGAWNPTPATAAINLFLGGGAPGVWEDGNNWITGAPPTGTDDVYLDGGVTVTSTAVNAFGGELQVGLEPNAYGRGNPGGKAVLNIDAGSITMGNKSIVVGQSQYTTANDNSGVINIAAGATLKNDGFVLIGFFGPLGTPTVGTINVNGGTLNSTGGGEFRIGGRDGNFNAGVLNLTGGGTVTMTKGVFLGGASDGTLNISGANSTFTTTQFISMGTDGANGTSAVNMTIAGGTVSCRELSVNEGKSVTSTLTQTAGALNLDQTTSGTSDLQIGRSTNGATALGVYNMSGGSLSVPRGHIKIASGNNGVFNVSGTAAVTVGATKSIQLNSNDRVGATAVVNQSGGTVTLAADSAEGVRFSGVGTTTYNLGGGTLTTPLITSPVGDGDRRFNFDGGKLVATGNINVANLATAVGAGGATIDTNGNTVTWDAPVSGTGGLTKQGAGTLSVTTSTIAGRTTVKAGTLRLGVAARLPVLSGAGGADLQGGTLVFDYSTITSPAATVRGLLKSARDSAVAGGTTPLLTGQIRSTTATDKRGLGYKDDGVNLLTIKPALYGDADLDGGVSINDFNALAGNFGVVAGKFWADGDFDYDGGVSINDFNLLAGSFGQTQPPGGDGFAGLLAFAAAHDDLAAFAAVTGVPEPTTLGLLSAGTALLLRRRRADVPA